ncbi:MAG: phosphotransferase [Pseudodesulfovibrio sp.]|nr:phosphotransferase [Pseudodesulfovibrio sp.]
MGRPVIPAPKTDILQDILSSFDISKDAAVAPLASSWDLCRIKTGSANLVLKKFWRLSPERAHVLDSMLKACSMAGITPSLLHTREGSTLLRKDKYFYSICEYIPPLAKPPADFVEQGANVVAKMHQILSTIPGQGIRAPLHVEKKTLLKILIKNDLSKYTPTLEQADEAKILTRSILVHNDLHPGNVLFGLDGKSYLIDFESFSHNPLVADALFAAFRLSKGNKQISEKFMSHYEQAMPLTPSEKQHGYLLLAADFIRKIAFIFKEMEDGNTTFMRDLEKYKRFASTAIQWAGQS